MNLEKQKALIKTLLKALIKQKALIKYEDFKNVLSNKSYTKYEMNRIQSKDHDIRSYRTENINLKIGQ